ncbi:hypothetical protein EON80_20225, partial [bacterium]
MARPLSLFSKGNLRKAVFFVHLWFGLFVGLYFAAIGVTGSILVFREDLERTVVMPERDFVAPPSPEAKLMPLAQIIAELKQQLPEVKEAELGFVNPPLQTNGAYLMRLTDGGKAEPTTIDPYTGKVIQRYPHGNKLLEWADDLHVNLLFEAPGKVANGYGGLLAGLLLLSGIWLWWPATLKQIKIRSSIKKGAPAQRVIADLHNVLGIYPFVALLIVTLTGSMIVFYKPIQDVVVARFGSAKIPRAPVVVPKLGAKMMTIDELMAIAERNSPESRYVFVMYPSAPTQPFYAYRRSEIGILPDTRIYLDPYNGKVLQIGKESTDPTSKKIMRSASGIHFGRWGSLGIKIVYFVLGFIPLGLFVTGILMFIRRRRSKVASQKRKKARIA